MGVEDTGAVPATRNGERSPGGAGTRERRAGRGWYWLLLLPLLGTLVPPIYNSADPRLIGIPFFYWYQMLWVALSVACTATVYRRTRGDRR